MKLILHYPNGKSYSYKGFTDKELLTILDKAWKDIIHHEVVDR